MEKSDAIPMKKALAGFGASATNPRCAASRTTAIGDALSEVWERNLGVLASRGDQLLDVLVNSHGVARWAA
jgi:hypothetical protein